MRGLADYILKVDNAELPVSAPVPGDLRRTSSSALPPGEGARVTLGVPAQDVPSASRHVGDEARLVTNIHQPGTEVARLRLLAVSQPMALIVGEILPRQSGDQRHGRR